MNFKRKDLLKLPVREWGKASEYDSIVLVPTGKKHDSGFALIAIVGINEKVEPVEIAAYCDDVCYSLPEKYDTPYAYEGQFRMAFRSDMYYPSGLVHVWSWYFTFKVGTALSSTDVFLVRKTEKRKSSDIPVDQTKAVDTS